VDFAAEDSWRGASNNLKVIVRRRCVTSVETRGGRESRQRSNCTTTLVKWSDCEDLLEVKSGTTAIAGGVVSSIELFSYAEHQSGNRWWSTNVCERDKLFDSRPAVLPPPLYSL